MGLIDKKTNIIQATLTDRGKRLLSKNKLNIKYFSVSDDEIDYKFMKDSLSDDEKEKSILNCPIFEPISDINIKNTNYSEDSTIQQRGLIYTIPVGQSYIPHINLSSTSSLNFGVQKSSNLDSFKESLKLDGAFTTDSARKDSIIAIQKSIQTAITNGNIVIEKLFVSEDLNLQEQVSFKLADYFTNKDGTPKDSRFKIEFYLSSSDGLKKMKINETLDSSEFMHISDYFDIETDN